MADTVSPDEQIGELAEEYLAAHRQGLRPSVASYAAAHPELAEEIRRLFPALLTVEELKPASGDATGSFADAAVVVRSARLERLGDFRILREVARGGMGVVYEAEQESLGRRVALKVLTAHELPDPAHLRGFQREARAAARLHHTNIVPVFGVGEQDRLHYYVMQFIQGLGLDEVIRELTRLRSGLLEEGHSQAPSPDVLTATVIARSLMTEHFVLSPRIDDDPSEPEPARAEDPGKGTAGSSSEVALASSGLSSVSHPVARYFRSVARLGMQVALALEYAHSQGIFHRDVKPSNLLLDVQGTAWVADFGLAKAVEGGNLTLTGDIVGTIRYMAPERFQGKCDARSDVYALGVTLIWEMSTPPKVRRSTPEPPGRGSSPRPGGLAPRSQLHTSVRDTRRMLLGLGLVRHGTWTEELGVAMVRESARPGNADSRLFLWGFAAHSLRDPACVVTSGRQSAALKFGREEDRAPPARRGATREGRERPRRRARRLRGRFGLPCAGRTLAGLRRACR